MKGQRVSPILAELCGFQDKSMEALYCSRRRLAMASIVRIWALFGTASVLATMLRREYNIWLINCGLALQAVRFLALRHYARGGSNSMSSFLQTFSFPVRAALLLTYGYYFSEVQHSLELLVPLFAVYDAVLFPFIEQGRVVLSAVLQLTCMLPAWTYLLWQQRTFAAAAALSLGITGTALLITVVLEVFHRQCFRSDARNESKLSAEANSSSADPAGASASSDAQQQQQQLLPTSSAGTSTLSLMTDRFSSLRKTVLSRSRSPSSSGGAAVASASSTPMSTSASPATAPTSPVGLQSAVTERPESTSSAVSISSLRMNSGHSGIYSTWSTISSFTATTINTSTQSLLAPGFFRPSIDQVPPIDDPAGAPQGAAAAPGGGATADDSSLYSSFDSMTDDDLMALREALFAPPSMEEVRQALRPLSTLHLRLPDGDPSQLQPGAKEQLMSEVSKAFPELHVLSCVVRRGSLLVAMNLVPAAAGSNGGNDGNNYDGALRRLAQAPSTQWLSWLGLPQGMEMTVQVVNHKPSSFLEGLPLAVVPLPGANTVTLQCAAGVAPGQAVRASFQGRDVPVTVVTPLAASDDDWSDSDCDVDVSGFPSAPPKLRIELWPEADSVGDNDTGAKPVHNESGLLMLEAWCHTTRTVVASLPLLVLPTGYEAAVRELSTAVAPSVIGLQGGRGGANAAAALPGARELVTALGWWLEVASGCSGGRATEEVQIEIEDGDKETTAQLLRHVGTRLLRLVVHQGRPATARLVLQALVGNRACGDTTLESVCSGEGQPLQRSILHLAMLSGCRAMVEEVMDWGTARGDPSAAGCWWALDQDGTTPLHIAALVDGGAIISKLLDASKGARQAWACLKGRRGLTPAELAERVARIVASGGGPVRGRGPVSVAPSNTDFDDLSSTPVSYDDVAAPDQVPVHKWAVIPAQGAIGAAGTEVAQNDACCATAAHDAGLQMGTKAAVKFNRAPGHGDGDAARAAQPAHHAAADAASPAPGPAPVATLLSTWLGFPDSALEAEYQAFKARAQKTMVGTWCLVKLVTMAITVLRAAAMVKDPLLPGLTSMLLLAAPYAILLYIQYCFGRPAPSACGATPCSQAEAFVQAAIEPLYVLSGLVRPVVHALWATGTLRYPPVTLHDWIVVYVCEMCCRHVMEQVRFPIMLLLDVLGVATVAAVWGAMGAARSLLLSFMAHTLALGIHTVADLRNRRAFLRCGGATACSLRTSAAGSKHAHDASLAAPPSASNRYRMKRE